MTAASTSHKQFRFDGITIWNQAVQAPISVRASGPRPPFGAGPCALPGWLLELYMKPATLIGIILIVVGIIGFAVGGFSFTHEKQDAKIGPLNIEHKQTESVPIPPILSGLALIGGIALVAVGARSR